MNKKIIEIIKKLQKKKLTLSVAESCTGGMLAQYITSISGASAVFNFGVITYSNKAKFKHLNVPYKILKMNGAVSQECCYSMVTNLAKISKAQLNLAITGIAGPRGGTKLKPVGLVYIGIKKNRKIEINKHLFESQNRESVRKNSVIKSLELIEKFI